MGLCSNKLPEKTHIGHNSYMVKKIISTTKLKICFIIAGLNDRLGEIKINLDACITSKIKTSNFYAVTTLDSPHQPPPTPFSQFPNFCSFS